MAITWGQIIERTFETPHEPLIKMKNTVQQEKKSTGKYQKRPRLPSMAPGTFLGKAGNTLFSDHEPEKKHARYFHLRGARALVNIAQSKLWNCINQVQIINLHIFNRQYKWSWYRPLPRGFDLYILHSSLANNFHLCLGQWSWILVETGTEPPKLPAHYLVLIQHFHRDLKKASQCCHLKKRKLPHQETQLQEHIAW